MTRDEARATKERPILFSAPMVRAILGRKTQTRRILKPKDAAWVEKMLPNFLAGKWDERPMPYGKPGDTLWVRETWQTHCDMDHISPSALPKDAAIQYPATYDHWVSKKRPAIHMPRWASRISLLVKDVRVERLQDISEKDAIAEGISRNHHGNGDQWVEYPIGSSAAGWTDPRRSFQSLWESINGPGSWTDNPWVAVVEFDRIKEKREAA